MGFIKLSISKGPQKFWNLMQFFAFINMLKGLDQHQYSLNLWWQTEMLSVTKCYKYISNMWMWNIIDNNNYFSYLIAPWCFFGSIAHDWFFFFSMTLFICWRKFTLMSIIIHYFLHCQNNDYHWRNVNSFTSFINLITFLSIIHINVTSKANQGMQLLVI